MTPDERQELRRKAEAATPGPWTTDEPQPRWITTNCEHIAIDEADWGPEVGNQFQVVTVDDNRAWSYADVRYIAATSPDVVLGLLDWVDELEAENERLRFALDKMRTPKWSAALDGVA